MQPTYAYPPPAGAEPYRASPTGSNMSLPSLNLPPIRAIDGQQQAPQQQHPVQAQAQAQAQPTAASPLPPPVATMGAYYPPPPQTIPPQHSMAMAAAPMGIPANMAAAMRYQLPPQGPDQRIMSGGRHKKEIKRRTKTGCLTCRKRRIKCDEAHPTCRNCQKSKRECLGYDPIFKQQPGPAQIQPAPSAAPQPVSAPAPVPPPSAPVAYSHVPQGYAPAASANYAPPIGHSASPPVPAPDQSYEFSSAIDPALAGAEATAPMSVAPVSYDPSLRIVKQEGAESRPADGQPLKARRIYIDDLFAVTGAPPNPLPPSTGPVTGPIVEEIKMLYARDYALGIDRCIETSWYSTKGLARLLNDQQTMALFAFFVTQIRLPPDYEGSKKITSLEAQLVWKLMCLVRDPAPAGMNGASGTAPGGEVDLLQKEAQLRLDVLEALLTYQVLPYNPLMELVYEQHVPPMKQFEVDFWRNLGQFVALRDMNEESSREIEATLGTCRNILGMIESRDVIYSMMVARHYGARFPDLPDNMHQAYTNEQEDDRSKMFVAKKFLEDEASGKGMSQVIFRLAGMSIRSWTLG
ncbi:uncharacterized protein K452DRAFT_220599 [Aplosporella prunicola CBS 121167]|uniref:Zn(2)-C6 fungal-type domain-containing protein n=1 Tax=Aplosporella prunicola CBS 121167 TaxID=1176127 RepID=A0A6A6BRP2_9PEZI|nr:uncharacterized protein K452DRAFT_220599 [Aplosporella prunicola CBS 121167]KAF2145487.1 hypothetical protein K452DRAFT_220599 [Aplosporella prunicola CBS 121167]